MWIWWLRGGVSTHPFLKDAPPKNRSHDRERGKSRRGEKRPAFFLGWAVAGLLLFQREVTLWHKAGTSAMEVAMPERNPKASESKGGHRPSLLLLYPLSRSAQMSVSAIPTAVGTAWPQRAQSWLHMPPKNCLRCRAPAKPGHEKMTKKQGHSQVPPAICARSHFCCHRRWPSFREQVPEMSPCIPHHVLLSPVPTHLHCCAPVPCGTGHAESPWWPRKSFNWWAEKASCLAGKKQTKKKNKMLP